MDVVLIMVCVSAYIGLLAQSRVKEDGIKWLSLALATGGIVLSFESGLTATAVTILAISQFVVWIYSATNLLRSMGANI